MNVEFTKEQVDYLKKVLCKTDFITDHPNTEAIMVGNIELQLHNAEKSWDKAMRKIGKALTGDPENVIEDCPCCGGSATVEDGVCSRCNASK